MAHCHTIPASANNEYCVFLFRVRDTGIQNGKTNEKDERIFSTGEIRVLEQHRKPIRPSRAKKNKQKYYLPKQPAHCDKHSNAAKPSVRTANHHNMLVCN